MFSNLFFFFLLIENGTSFESTTTTNNLTINYADNEIDNGHEIAGESTDADDGHHITMTELPRHGITLAQPPPRSPNSHGSSGGPFFEEGPEPQNVTAKLGTSVLLDCKIGLLYDKTVSQLTLFSVRLVYLFHRLKSKTC